MANVDMKRKRTEKTRKMLICILAAVLVVSVGFGVFFPYIFRAGQTAQLKQVSDERTTSAGEVQYDKVQEVSATVGKTTELKGLMLYNPDGTVMPASNNHLHFMMVYSYRPYKADGTQADTIYTYNYVTDQQTFGFGTTNNVVGYPAANPVFSIEYMPPETNGVTFGLKVTFHQLTPAGEGKFQLRYFSHVGEYGASNNCKYDGFVGEDCLESTHALYDHKYTDFNCNFGLFETPTIYKRQVINFTVTTQSATEINTAGSDANGYIKYSAPGSGFTPEEYSVPESDAKSAIVINPSTFVSRTDRSAALYTFASGNTDLQSSISKLYTKDITTEQIDPAAFDIKDYFDVSYVPYVKNLSSDLLLGIVPVAYPTMSQDATLAETGDTDYTYFSKTALALKLTPKADADIEKLYGRTLFFTAKIKKIGYATDDAATVKFKFRIVNPVSQQTASYDTDNMVDATEYNLVTDKDLDLTVSKIMLGGSDDRFKILAYSDDRVVGFCNKHGEAGCDGTIDATHGHQAVDTTLRDAIDFDTLVSGSVEVIKRTRLDEANNKIILKRKENITSKGPLPVLVRVWDVRTNLTYVTCVAVRVADEGASAWTPSVISANLRRLSVTVPKVLSDGTLSPTETQTVNPITAAQYDSMLGSGMSVRYAMINFNMTNYTSSLLANGIFTPQELKEYTVSGQTPDDIAASLAGHPMMKYGLTIKPSDIYNISNADNIPGFDIADSDLNRVFTIDGGIYGTPTLSSNEFYLAWMVDSVDRNLHIIPLKSTKFMTDTQKTRGMNMIPFGQGSTAADIPLAIIGGPDFVANDNQIKGTGRWLKFSFGIDNSGPDRTSISDVTDLLKSQSEIDDRGATAADFPANTIKLISNHDGYNRYAAGVENNNKFNLPKSFTLDVYDYINDADVYRMVQDGRIDESKKGYDTLRFDINNGSSQLPGWASSPYGNKILVEGSNDKVNFYSWSQLQSMGITKVRFLRFTALENAVFTATVVVTDSGNMVTSGKFTINVVDSKPIYYNSGTAESDSGIIHNIISNEISDPTAAYRDNVLKNYVTLRTLPIKTNGKEYITSYKQWTSDSGSAISSDYDVRLNNYTNTATIYANNFVRDPDNDSIKIGSTKPEGYNVVPLKIKASDIGGEGIDEQMFYAKSTGTGEYETYVTDARGQILFQITINVASNRIVVKARASYKSPIEIYFIVGSQSVQDGTFIDADDNYFGFTLRLLNSKPTQNASVAHGTYVGGNVFKFGTANTYNAEGYIKDYLTDVDSYQTTSDSFYIVSNEVGYNGTYKDNIQVGVENSDGTQSWVDLTKYNNTNYVDYNNGSLTVKDGEAVEIQIGMLVSFNSENGLQIEVKGAMRNKLYVRFYVTNFMTTGSAGVNILQDNRQNCATQVTYSFTVSGGDVKSKLDVYDQDGTFVERKKVQMLQTGVTSASEFKYAINNDGYVVLPLSDVAQTSSNVGFYFAGSRELQVSYDNLLRNVVSAEMATLYLDLGSTGTLLGYYVKHTDGTISKSANQAAIVFYVDESNVSSAQIWLRPKMRTTAEGFSMTLRLSDSVETAKKDTAYNDCTYGQKFTDVTFAFSIENFGFKIASNTVTGTDGVSFSYKDSTFNKQHDGISFSIATGEPTSKDLLLYDKDGIVGGAGPHVRMVATAYSQTKSGSKADVNDYYYISMDANKSLNNAFELVGVESSVNPAVYVCGGCGKVQTKAAGETDVICNTADCSNFGTSTNISTYYSSVLVKPILVTNDTPEAITFNVMDFMASTKTGSDGVVSKTMYAGSKFVVEVKFYCADAPEIVKNTALRPGSSRTQMDIDGQYVYDMDVAGAKFDCPEPGGYHKPVTTGNNAFVFCDGLYHYKAVNYEKTSFDSLPSIPVYLSDIFDDSDLTVADKKFDITKIRLKMDLTKLDGTVLSTTGEFSLDGNMMTKQLGLENKDKIVQITITPNQQISIKLLSRTGIEAFEEGVFLKIRFSEAKSVGTQTGGASYDILIKTLDNPMLVRQSDMNVTVEYDSVGNKYEATVPVSYLAFDFNAGDRPTLPDYLSAGNPNPLIDISYQSAAADSKDVGIRDYIELKATAGQNQEDYIKFSVKRFHSEDYAKTDLYGNNVYACRPLVQVRRDGTLLETSAGKRTPDEMRTIRFTVQKKDISLNNTLNSAYTFLGNVNALKRVQTGEAFDLFSAPEIVVPDPILGKLGKWELVNINEAYKYKINNTESIISSSVIANFSEASNDKSEMIYFSKEFKIYMMDASDPTVKEDVSSNGYVSVNFNENSFWVNGDSTGNNSGSLQGDVRMTVVSKKPITQNQSGSKYLRLVVTVQDLYGKTLSQNIDFVTSNKAITSSGKDNPYYNEKDSQNNPHTFSNFSLKSAEEAWGTTYPNNSLLPEYAFNNLSVSNIIKDLDFGSYYVKGKESSTYNAYRVKVTVNGLAKYFIPMTQTPENGEVNELYLLRQGKDERTTITDTYDPNLDTRYAVIKLTESGQFLLYPVRSTVGITTANKYFNFEVEEWELFSNDLGAKEYKKCTTSTLKCRFYIDIPDSKPTLIEGVNTNLQISLDKPINVNMDQFIFDYDGDPVRISSIDISGNENYISVSNSAGDSSFTLTAKRKFIKEDSQLGGNANPHFTIPVKVYFTDSLGEIIDTYCEFTLTFVNNAPQFTGTDDNDPNYKYSLSGTELTITYKDSSRSQAGSTISHNLSSFIRDKDFPTAGADSDGTAVGEYISVLKGAGQNYEIKYTLREFDDFIRQTISADSSVGESNSVSFKVRDSSNAYPIYKDTEIVNIKLVVVTANSDPFKKVNADGIVGVVTVGKSNTISPTGTELYPIAGDVNRNDRLSFVVPTKLQDDGNGNITEVPNEEIMSIYSQDDPGKRLVHVYHVSVNNVYDGSTIKIDVHPDYTSDKMEITITETITVRDSFGGQIQLSDLKFKVTLPPQDALIDTGITTDTDRNQLVAYKGIPMKFTTDAASGVPSGSSKFDGDIMLFNINNLFQSKYADRITILSIEPGAGYTVDNEKKLITINKDCTDDKIVIKVNFDAGGVTNQIAVECKVANAKEYAFEPIGSLNEATVKLNSNKVISVGSFVSDPHGGTFVISSVLSSDKRILEVSMQNDGKELVLTPLKSGTVSVTVVIVDRDNPDRFATKAFEVALTGYPALTFIDVLFGNVWYVAAIGGGVLLVLIIVIVLIVKASKKKKLMKELETMLLAEMDAEEQLKLSGGNDIPMLGMGLQQSNMQYLGTGSSMPGQMYLGAGMGSQMNQGYGQSQMNNFGQSQMFDPNQFGGQSQMNNFGQSQMNNFGQSQMNNFGQSQMMNNQGFGQSQMYDPNQFAGQSQMMNQGYGSQMMNQQQPNDPNQFGGDFFDLNDFNNYNR